MISKTTLPRILWPLMGKPSIKADHCMICGRTSPLNEHHIVRRGAGKLYDESGREIKPPTITLCGMGNHLRSADGNVYCHGLAHANRLHFRWVEAEPDRRDTYHFKTACAGHYEYILLDEPTKYQDALEMEGWRRLWTR